MALVTPKSTKMFSISCFPSKIPNNSPSFLSLKFRSPVASWSANSSKSSIPSYSYTQESTFLKQFDHKLSYEHLHETSIKKVKNILMANADDPLESLEMIDMIQGLGIDLHFQLEIDQILENIYKDCTQYYGRDLRVVALCFRLLRQQGHHAQENMFKNILENKDGFKDDVEALMELYEASELRVEGEEILESAREFALNRLIELCSRLQSDQDRKIMASLTQSRHKTLSRLTSEKFISMIKTTGRKDNEWLQSLLQVAEIDSMVLKSLIQEEISQTFKWWGELGLEKELKKIRNQPLKWHTWSMAVLQDPTMTEQRLDLTKPISFVYVIDDIFDVYGGIEELTIFTNVVERWDHEGLEKLPNYMKACFKALDLVTMEISLKIYKSYGWNPTDSLTKAWGSLCKAFLVEAKWFDSGYLPTTEEYMKNAVVSSGVHLVMLHVYFLLGEELTIEKVELMETNPRIVSSAAMILRLWDDLGSAKDENQDGLDGSFVECYLNEHKGSTVDEARTQVVQKISEAWKCLNRECLNPTPFSRSFSKTCLNSARTISIMYSYDDDQQLPDLDEFLNLLM